MIGLYQAAELIEDVLGPAFKVVQHAGEDVIIVTRIPEENLGVRQSELSEGSSGSPSGTGGDENSGGSKAPGVRKRSGANLP
jgi:hypothetical protein